MTKKKSLNAVLMLPEVDLLLNQVRYGGECYNVTPDGATLMHNLCEKYPDWFSASSIISKPSAIKGDLPPR